MLVVGLTGNYGMGKSTVLGMFRELGADTIDADEIVDGLLRDKSILEDIRRAFGDKVLLKDGQVDRAYLASLIFRDRRMRDTLEGLIHPLVFKKIEELLKDISDRDSGDKIVVIEIPLMFETGRAHRFDRTVTVYADEGTVLPRLREKGVSRGDAESRIRSQMTIDEKIRRSDFAIDNSGSPDETRLKVREIYDRLLLDLKR